jgi:predicted ester cyclase
MSKEERNKKNFQALYDQVMNTGNLPLTDQFMISDRPDHDPGFPPEMTTGRDGFKRAIGWIRSVFPDLTFTTEFMVAEGDYVVCYNHVEGTNSGEFMGAAGNRQESQSGQH